MSDLSRVEQLLRNALGEDIYEVTPQSRVEVLLQQLNEYIEGMGEGSIDPEVITAWLAENIHDGAVVDSSLTVEGAAADSKKTGTEISQIKEDLNTVFNEIGNSPVTIVPTSEYEKLGKYWTVNGTTLLASMSTSNSYNACNPIDISGLKDGTPVKILGSLAGSNTTAITDVDMKAIDYVNGNNASEKGYTAGSTPQVVTFTKTANTKYIIATIRSAYYTGVSDFTVYGTEASVIDSIDADIDDLQNRTEALENVVNGEKILTVTKSGNSYTVLSDYDGTSQLKRTLSYGERTNGLFEFENDYIVTSGVQTKIKDSTDDITPMRLGANGSLRTVGANHGWPAFTVAKGSLTQDDVGSIWTDGTNSFILAKVDATLASFIYPATLINSEFVYNTTMPEINLTHVSGATHTGSIDITDAESANIFPSVNNKSCSFYADTVEITANGTYHCNKFVVIEQYDIMDYADISNYLKAHIGSDVGNDNIKGCVRLYLRYEFNKTSCVISTAFEALENVKFSNCGVLQAIRADYTNKSLYRYLNGVGAGHHFNSANVVDITNDSTGYTIYPADLADSNVPTNRCVDLVKSNGSMDWGFCFGFLPDVSRGADEYRKSLTQIWSLRSDSKKSYPVVFYGETKSQGYYADVIGYRNYLKPALDATNVSVIEVGESLYVIVDFHEQKTNYAVAIPQKYLGKTITAIEAVNLTLSSSAVGTRGIVVSTSESYGCGILKVT